MRGTEPSAFNGPVVRFQPLPVPQVFEVNVANAPDPVEAGSKIEAELKATLGLYIDQSIQYSMDLMAHGPGYSVATATPYTQNTDLNTYNVAPPPAPPRQIRARLP